LGDSGVISRLGLVDGVVIAVSAETGPLMASGVAKGFEATRSLDRGCGEGKPGPICILYDMEVHLGETCRKRSQPPVARNIFRIMKFIFRRIGTVAYVLVPRNIPCSKIITDDLITYLGQAERKEQG